MACSPQAWAAGAPFALLEACLGLSLDAHKREIRFVNPTLPKSLEEIRLKGLHFEGASIDVHLARRGDDVSVDVTRREGDVRVAVLK